MPAARSHRRAHRYPALRLPAGERCRAGRLDESRRRAAAAAPPWV